MKDYISREAGLFELCRGCSLHGNAPDFFCGEACPKYERIAAIPAADVRPVVRGKWVYDHWCEFKCSNCGAWSKSEPYRGRENFCPNCGCAMGVDN